MIDILQGQAIGPYGTNRRTTISGGSEARLGILFREQLGHQLKEEYRKHFNDLFDELTALAGTLEGRIDLSLFERYAAVEGTPHGGH